MSMNSPPESVASVASATTTVVLNNENGHDSEPEEEDFHETDESDPDDEVGSDHDENLGLIIDEELEAEVDSDSGSEILDGKKRKKKRNYDDRLEDDDYDLLEENLGVKLQRRKFKRIRNQDVDSEDEDAPEGLGEKETIANQLFETADEDEVNEDLPDLPESRSTHRGPEQYPSDESDESDADDFIVDDVPANLQNFGTCTDASLTAARDIFGTEFDYDEIRAEGDDESDEDEEEETRIKPAVNSVEVKYNEIYEPVLLERAGMTLKQRAIRKSDIPERYLVRHNMTVEQIEQASQETVELEDLEEESKWIYENVFKSRDEELWKKARTNLAAKKAEEQRLEKEAADAEERQSLGRDGDCESMMDGGLPLAPASSITNVLRDEGDDRPALTLPRPSEASMRLTSDVTYSEDGEESGEASSLIANFENSAFKMPALPVRRMNVKPEICSSNESNAPPPALDDEDDWDAVGRPAVSEAPTVTASAMGEVDPELKAEYTNIVLAHFLKRIKKVLDFIRIKYLEVPFIWYYHRDDISPEFTNKDLWNIYKSDLKFKHFNNRKQNLIRQLNNMKAYITNLDMDYEVVDDLLKQAEAVLLPIELGDLWVHFKLLFSVELPKMKEILNTKRLEEHNILNEEDSDNETEETDLRKSKPLNSGSGKFMMMEKTAVGEMAEKFGLSAENYSENLSSNYLRYEAVTPDITPFQQAVKFVNEY